MSKANLSTLLAQRAELDRQIAQAQTARTFRSGEEKLAIVARAVKGERIVDLAAETGVHQSLISKWKRQALEAVSAPVGRPRLATA